MSSDSGEHNNSVQEGDTYHTEACAFDDADFGVYEARLISDTMQMTDIEVKAMQAGFKTEEVKTRVGEVTKTFRQRSLRNEAKNMELKKKRKRYWTTETATNCCCVRVTISTLCTTARKGSWRTGTSSALYVTQSNHTRKTKQYERWQRRGQLTGENTLCVKN